MRDGLARCARHWTAIVNNKTDIKTIIRFLSVIGMANRVGFHLTNARLRILSTEDSMRLVLRKFSLMQFTIYSKTKESDLDVRQFYEEKEDVVSETGGRNTT
jgi:hypothetical protein